MKKISLTKGCHAIIDDEEEAYLSGFRWYAMTGKNAHGIIYAARDVRVNGKRKTIYMHKIVINAPDECEVDHINHNSLDNRKTNLRIASHKQNLRNMSAKTNKFGYKGIHKNNTGHKFSADIWVNYRKIHLGSYETPREAAEVYDDAARKYFGSFAALNFPKGNENANNVPSL